MSVIERKATGVQTMAIANCPCCGGEIAVSDCGYTSFNPGVATCMGECKRKWGFASVEDRWDCGVQWNQRASEIRKKLKLLSLLGVKRRPVSISRDFHQEQLEEEAQLLLKSFEDSVIGACERSRG